MAADTLVIACDGPARAGKTTLARNFEVKLGVPRLSTGNIYRGLAIITLRKLDVASLGKLDDTEIAAALASLDLASFKADFSGRVWFEGEQLQDLTSPAASEGASLVSHIDTVRSKIVEPLVIAMVEECDKPLVFSEGRDEGRIWREAHRLGLAIFLSVDPLVAAMRERGMRQTNGHEIPSLRELMTTLMKYDLDNAARLARPTFIDDEPELFNGSMTPAVKRAVHDRRQVIVPTSGIDTNTVFKRVFRLAETAGMLNDANSKQQVSIL